VPQLPTRVVQGFRTPWHAARRALRQPQPMTRQMLIASALRIGTVLGAAGVACGGYLYFTQERFIFPGALHSPGTALSEAGDTGGISRFLLRSAAGERIAALYAPAQTARGVPLARETPRPVFLWFYGNAMTLRDAEPEVQLLRRLGVDVLAADYVGYGESDGLPSERGCAATADALLAHVRGEPFLSTMPLFAGGWSLGGAVAIDLASREPLAGVVALSTFTSMADLAGMRFPWLPARLLLRHHFESERKLQSIRCPLFLGHGREDEVAPFAMFERLRSAAAGPVTAYPVDGAGHNDLLDQGGAPLFAALARFLHTAAPVE
jgi:pimeloyl-ACP methyl ester carboxylesterase